MNATRFDSFALMIGAALTAPSPARADSSPREPIAASADSAAAAQQLFVEGRRLVALGRFADGCSKLEQSERIEPAAGTEINLADCYEKSGRIASAWMVFHHAVAVAQRTGRAEWAEQARERARALEPSMPELTVIVDTPAQQLVVRRDGTPIEPPTLGAPVPVDPGVYAINATAPGHRPWSTHLAVEAGAHVVLHVPELAPALPDPIAAEEAPPRGAAILRPPDDRPGGSMQQTAGLVLGAAALGWLAAGTILGLKAISDNNGAGARCPTSPRCSDPSAVTMTNDARRAANASTAAFVAGGALLASGAMLYFTVPRSPLHASIHLGPASGQWTLGGFW